MFAEPLLKQCEILLADCRLKGLTLATAESCTGGLISALLTEIPGSSAVFERGFVTYSNASKTALLGVSQAMIEKHGAVSETVARAMAEGAKTRAVVALAVSVTGIAGPDGGSKEKPVGTVCIAVSGKNATIVKTFHFTGNRSQIRLQSAEAALKLLLLAEK